MFPVLKITEPLAEKHKRRWRDTAIPLVLRANIRSPQLGSTIFCLGPVFTAVYLFAPPPTPACPRLADPHKKPGAASTGPLVTAVSSALVPASVIGVVRPRAAHRKRSIVPITIILTTWPRAILLRQSCTVTVRRAGTRCPNNLLATWAVLAARNHPRQLLCAQCPVRKLPDSAPRNRRCQDHRQSCEIE